MRFHHLLIAASLGLRLSVALAQTPTPLVAWDCGAPAGARPGDTLALDRETFQSLGSARAFGALRFLPSGLNDGLASRCTVAWADGQRGPGAVRLCASSQAAEAGATLQWGGP
ncbi:MAG: hypothetical protein WCP21_17260, partial [Armatimonadota bacterium]